MYELHWRLKHKPFDNQTGASPFVPLHTHQGALLKLRYLVDEQKGIALLVGEHGIGKSFLTRVLEEEIVAKNSGPFIRLLIPQISATGMLAYLAHRLGVQVDRAHDEFLILAELEQRLTELTADGKHALFVIEDAHLLELEHLQLLRSLLNLRESVEIQFSVILCGRPELIGQLKMVAGLDQRLVVRAAIEPLTQRETERYIIERMRAAGGSGNEFCLDAVKRLWQLTQGIPRKLNQLADLTLLVGYVDELPSIGVVEVNAAAEELMSVALPRAA